jgi:hypothetical protein
MPGARAADAAKPAQTELEAIEYWDGENKNRAI